jgi:dolichyl-phosphate-mannose--protein O-mannosyl transferase
MTVTIPLVAVAAAIVYFAHRYMGMRMWHALVSVILGFLLAATTAAPEIQKLLTALVQWLQKP